MTIKPKKYGVAVAGELIKCKSLKEAIKLAYDLNNLGCNTVFFNSVSLGAEVIKIDD